jgi:23S rRNA (uracil747-C5)-methyltransferase
MPPTFQSLFESLRGLVTEYEISPYNIGERRGELKHIILLSNADTSQVILRFILRSAGLVPRIRKLVGLLQDSFPWIRVVTCNIQPKHAAILEGADEIFLTQERQIRECFGDIPLYLSPQSFMQVTPEIAHKLYTRAQEFAQLHAPKMVLDLFCGVGGFALHTAKSASSLIGVEVSPSAIASAMRSAGEMGLKNTLFISADVDEFLRSYSGSHPDLIIVNPPRRGLSKEAVAHIVSLAPQRILYSSCSPESFARDAQLLSGYTLERITPFDMFPMTMHCEVLGEFCLS